MTTKQYIVKYLNRKRDWIDYHDMRDSTVKALKCAEQSFRSGLDRAVAEGVVIRSQRRAGMLIHKRCYKPLTVKLVEETNDNRTEMERKWHAFKEEIKLEEKQKKIHEFKDGCGLVDAKE